MLSLTPHDHDRFRRDNPGGRPTESITKKSCFPWCCFNRLRAQRILCGPPTSGFAMAPVSRSASPPMTGFCARSTSAFPRFRHRHRLRRHQLPPDHGRRPRTVPLRRPAICRGRLLRTPMPRYFTARIDVGDRNSGSPGIAVSLRPLDAHGRPDEQRLSTRPSHLWSPDVGAGGRRGPDLWDRTRPPLAVSSRGQSR